jgi:CDP-diacylglycerol---glycerol-3-phosphate 3-phosphatidyltransferase
MLNVLARARISRVLDPLGQRLARTRLTPNLITAVGTLGVVGGALVFYSNGWFFVGTLVITVFVLADMLDGTVARARGVSGPWGAFLDSTSDRIADGAVFGALIWWFFRGGNSAWLGLAALLCLISGAVVSYAKARAEGLGLSANVGFAERAERLIIVLVGTGLDGLGVPYVQAIALWFLVAATFLTVAQRFAEVYRQAHGVATLRQRRIETGRRRNRQTPPRVRGGRWRGRRTRTGQRAS